MDTTPTLPWEYLTERTAERETFTRMETLDIAGVLAGCMADPAFAAQDKHRWAAIQLLHNPQRVSAFLNAEPRNTSRMGRAISWNEYYSSMP